jgi:very-long-chain enoyl-CoA reductase
MVAKVLIELSNRTPKKPLKKLPPNVEADASTSVEDVKKSIARAAGIGDHNRVGLFNPSTGKTLKDRHAKVASLGLESIQVKDLGPQLDWTTVFVVEYAGPLLFHIAIPMLRPWIYPFSSVSAVDVPLSSTQKIAWAMIVLHFLKREYETLFVHKFSASTMPARNIFKNSFFYWALSGLLAAYTIYAPDSLAARADQPLVDAAGLVLYAFGEIANALVHRYLATLRSTGGTERKIPHGYGFGIVTCPNYMYEIIAWGGIIVTSRSWACAIFIAVGAAQMYQWARGKEKAYRAEFGDKYKKKRYVLLPGLA